MRPTLQCSIPNAAGALLLCLGCSHTVSQKIGLDIHATAHLNAFQTDTPSDTNAIVLELSEGLRERPAGDIVEITATVVPDSVIDPLFATLPSLPAQAPVSFSRRDDTPPPPLTGRTVVLPFPPPVTAPKAPASERSTARREVTLKETRPTIRLARPGPLRVERFAPEGPVRRESRVEVTFSEPMVTLTDLDANDPSARPVQLEPQPAGEWRWEGTKTLRFEARPRFPMATAYRVRIPAGIQAQNGARLTETVEFEFNSTTPRLDDWWPGDHRYVTPQPVLVLVFDQEIDPDSAAAAIRIEIRGRIMNVSPVAPDKISDPEINNWLGRMRPKHWVAIRPERRLPPDANGIIRIGPNFPSAEGPVRSNEFREIFFATYAPLTARGANCESPCEPGSPLRVNFNNRIDRNLVNDSLVSVTPSIPGMKIEWRGTDLIIMGMTRGRTRYEVHLDRSITDIFGQKLGTGKSIRFETGTAPQRLYNFLPAGMVLDPEAPRVHRIYSVNVRRIRCRLWRVGPRDWHVFGAFQQTLRDTVATPPGQAVVDTIMTIPGGGEEFIETVFDLNPALTGGLGQCVILVEPLIPPLEAARQRYAAWIQSTRIGLDVLNDASGLTAWATDLRDGSPLSGVEVTMQTGATPTAGVPLAVGGFTNRAGVVTLPLSDEPQSLVVGRLGHDLAILPSDGTWVRTVREPRMAGYVFCDRGLYQPGEQLHFKGWIRNVGGKEGLGLPAADLDSVEYQVLTGRNSRLSGTLPVSSLFGFQASITLPPDFPPGTGQIVIRVPGEHQPRWRDYVAQLQFDVQEFRRPEYTARVQADPGPWRLGDRVTATLDAQLFTGSALADVPVTWKVEASRGFFAPPNWRGFNFQADSWPHRRQRNIRRLVESSVGDRAGWSGSLDGRTDQDGRHRLQIDVRRIEPPTPLSLRIAATASDLNRQTLADQTSLLVHPSDVYVGLKSKRRFVLRGEPLQIEMIVASIEGAAVQGRPVKLECVRIEQQRSNREEEYHETQVRQMEIVSGRTAKSVKLGVAAKAGIYQVRASVTDPKGRPNQSAVQIRVEELPQPAAQRQQWQSGFAGLRHQTVTITCDREDYAPGDTVVMVVSSPLHPAHGLLVISGRDISTVERFEQDGPSCVLKSVVPRNSPNALSVQVILNGRELRRNDEDKPERHLPFSPATATGRSEIAIRPRDRELNVRIVPARSEVEPGDSTMLSLVVTDATGRAEPRAEAAVVVVDESILSIGGHSFENPLHYFPLAPFTVQRSSSRNLVRLSRVEDLRLALAGGDGFGGAAGLRSIDVNSSSTKQRAMIGFPPDGVVANGGELHFRGGRSGEALEAIPVTAFQDAIGLGAGVVGGPPRLRTIFSPIAVFAGTVITDDRGAASLPIRLPDNLTRYRIVAVAAAGSDRFGIGESNITARLSLMVRPSPPRFLNAGDRFELPLIVENQTDGVMDALVGARAVNALFPAGRGRRVVLPPHRRAEVRFPCVTQAPGQVDAQVAVLGGEASDAAELSIPVWTPATVEAFASYGEIDGNGSVSYQVAPPPDVHPGFGGLDVSTSSTALQSLTDAVIYLCSYPYDCSEQRASRVLAISTLRDVLKAFGAAGLPDSAAMARFVREDIEQIGRTQVENGGFSFWPGTDEYPWLGIYVAHVLRVASLKGYPVPQEILDRSIGYLESMPFLKLEELSPDGRTVLRCYALYVLSLFGKGSSHHVKQLVDEVGVGKLPVDCAAWLLSAVSDDAGSDALRARLVRHILNRVTETAGLAHVITSVRESDQLTLGSDRRVDAVVLDALLSARIAPDLAAKLARSLLAQRRNGRWRSTQENAFVLMALEHYFRSAEGITPDCVTRCWLGDTFAGEFRYHGRTTERQQLTIPMAAIVRATEAPGKKSIVAASVTAAGVSLPSLPLLLHKAGPGRLYYRLGLRWAPRSTAIPAENAGFKVTRFYDAVDDSGDVVRDSSGVVHVLAGARVRVTVSMMTPSRRYHVALVDPLPGGFEPLNPVLRGTDLSPALDGAPGSLSQRFFNPLPTRHNRAWWFDHENLRNERAEVFCSWLREGNYSYSYLARATTPGEFTASPPRAEEMYSPETFGRGESARVVIEVRK